MWHTDADETTSLRVDTVGHHGGERMRQQRVQILPRLAMLDDHHLPLLFQKDVHYGIFGRRSSLLRDVVDRTPDILLLRDVAPP